LLADVQTADIPDGASFHGAARFYRAALDGAASASAAFAADAVDGVVHLGDLLDAQAAPHAEELVVKVLDLLAGAGAPVYHAVGNHCLAALGRAGVNAHLAPPPGRAVRWGVGGGSAEAATTATPSSPPPLAHSHYEVDLDAASRLRLVVLDGFAVSLLGWPEGHPLREEAAATLAAHNPNPNKFSAEGLVGPARRYVAFGGGLGAAQLAWLEGRLAAAAAEGARVVLACHLPLHPDTAPGVCLLWEYEAVLAAIASVPPGTVIASLAGHSHRDGAATCAATGTHHRVLASVLETPPGQVCHARLDLFEEAVVIRGAGLAADTWAPVVGGQAR
jgi:manganese-dependent ADP-ribose/CDP-alcohol diphosphatase